MRRSTFFLCLPFVVSLGVARAAEPQFAAPLTFSFDQPGGFFIDHEDALTCSTNAVRGVASFRTYRTKGEWVPNISVILRRGKAPGGRVVVLKFGAVGGHPPFHPLMQAATDDDQTLALVRFAARVGADGRFSFLLRWNAKGQVIGEAQGEVHDLDLGGPPEQLEIDGSSGAGEVVYQLGTFPDAKADAACRLVS